MCFSIDGGATYYEQTTFGDAFIVSCPAGFKGPACDVEATTLDINDDNGVVFFGDDDEVALYLNAGELHLTSDMSAGTLTSTSLVVGGVDIVAKLADLLARLNRLQCESS